MKKKSTENKLPLNLKVIVSGAFNSGKTHFIRTISDNNVLSTEKNISSEHEQEFKKLTTVAMDFAKVKFNDSTQIFFFGTPGQKRFDFMWEILSYKMYGGIIMVDSGRFYESLDETRIILDYFIKFSSVPLIVAANKQDLQNAISPQKIKQELNLPKTVPVLPCIATCKNDVKEVSHYLVNSILRGE
ncbi:ATP/GTP-binding protein [Candidatus Poribacteria bacterium]|nr:ATP/GTP-binding protein [Candidatus Poribacteria bacterium]